MFLEPFEKHSVGHPPTRHGNRSQALAPCRAISTFHLGRFCGRPIFSNGSPTADVRRNTWMFKSTKKGYVGILNIVF